MKTDIFFKNLVKFPSLLKYFSKIHLKSLLHEMNYLR